MKTAKNLDNLPPYLFAQIDAKRDALVSQGIDVISLGIGDPDIPTPEHIVIPTMQAQKLIGKLAQAGCNDALV